ncbi:MAG TPA: AzlD domain-containing protein [Alphaproteobacteria bacterium]|nr:AzlD domain-containing protein [Alphaproteobacteria bacterium]
MPDAQVLAAIVAVGIASYAMRVGGFLAASVMPQHGMLPRLLRLAPGNLVVAFAAAGIQEGGWPSLAGCLAAVATMVATNREWAALGAGFAAAALAAAVM